MLAIGLEQAKRYSTKPCLLARDTQDSSKDVYWVEDATLPCLSCKESPLSLVDRKRLFALKKKYRVSDRTFRQIEKFYQSDKETFNWKKSDLGTGIMIKEIEDIILRTLKTTYRSPSTSLMPYYDAELSGRIALHTSAIGPSSSGKSTVVSHILRDNFNDGTTIWVFSPTATSDPVWKELQKEIGRKRVRLVDTHKIVAPVDLETQIGRGNVLVFDDQDAVHPSNEKYTSALCSRAQYEGRHMTDKRNRGMVCFSIFHDGFSRRVRSLKSTNIESTRVILFPNQQRHVARKVMKSRLGLSAQQIKEIFAFVVPKDRWIMLVQHCPACVITQTGVLLL